MKVVPSDTRKWVTTFDKITGKKDAVLLEVIDKDNVRVWYPQVKKTDGSRGSITIREMDDIVCIGPDVELPMICF